MKTTVALLVVSIAMLGGEGALVEGNPRSETRVIIYEDLQCPDCARFGVMLDQQILPKYGSKAAFEHRDFPLPKHKWARQAAIASRHFESMGQSATALAWRRYALSHLSEITPENFKEKLSSWAQAQGQDPAKALAALEDQKLAAAVEADYQDGVARGIAHTPTVLVNGEPFIETFTFEEIAASLDKATGSR